MVRQNADHPHSLFFSDWDSYQFLILLRLQSDCIIQQRVTFVVNFFYLPCGIIFLLKQFKTNFAYDIFIGNVCQMLIFVISHDYIVSLFTCSNGCKTGTRTETVVCIRGHFNDRINQLLIYFRKNNIIPFFQTENLLF